MNDSDQSPFHPGDIVELTVDMAFYEAEGSYFHTVPRHVENLGVSDYALAPRGSRGVIVGTNGDHDPICWDIDIADLGIHVGDELITGMVTYECNFRLVNSLRLLAEVAE